MQAMNTVYSVAAVLIVHVCGTALDNMCVYREVDICVADYNEFEKKTFVDNTACTHKLYKVFYPPNGHLPYSVEVTYQTVLPNGTQVDIITQGVKVWIWMSSPLFLQARPKDLNRLIFYTLHIFREWIPPCVHIQVPCIQQNVTYGFLLQMTASLEDYALGNIKTKRHPRNVLTKEKLTYRVPNPPNKNQESTEDVVYIFLLVYSVGNVLQSLLVWAVMVAVIKTNIKHVVSQSYLYSYQHYGLMCGATIVALGLVIVDVRSSVLIALEVEPSYTQEIGRYTLYIGLIGVCILPGIPIAIYFTYKTKPPAIPYIIMIPVALLFCCCNTQRAKSLVFGVALWINMMAAQVISFTATVLVFAVLAEPLIIIANSLILILLAFCLTNIFALLFTISAYLFTPRHRRPQGRRETIIRAAILIPLLLATICYCVALALGTQIKNGKTTEGDTMSVIGSAIVPLIIGVVTVGLKHLIMTALESNTDCTSQTDTERTIKMFPNAINASEDEQPLEM